MLTCDSKNMNSRQPGWQRQSGFSLVEAMVSLFILTVAVLAMTSGLIASTGLQASSSEINEAGKAASEILESFRRMSYIVLEDGVAAGDYTVEELSAVYDSDNVAHEILDVNTINRIRQNMNSLGLAETVTVEHASEAVRISVEINRTKGNKPPVVSMASLIVKNGINFR